LIIATLFWYWPQLSGHDGLTEYSTRTLEGAARHQAKGAHQVRVRQDSGRDEHYWCGFVLKSMHVPPDSWSPNDALVGFSMPSQQRAQPPVRELCSSGVRMDDHKVASLDQNKLWEVEAGIAFRQQSSR
jgi:hypothetical protein